VSIWHPETELLECLMVPRRGAIAVGVVILLVGGAVLAWRAIPRDHTVRTTVGGAVRTFRNGLHGGTEHNGRVPGFPRAGVYRYATRGGERLDTAILSTAHNYDGVSTIAITPSRCGIVERWQVFSARWSEGTVCAVPSGTRLRALAEYREFFGTAKSAFYGCGGASTPPLSHLRAGERWTSRCTSEAGAIVNRFRVAGTTTVRVGGQPMKAVHIEIAAVLTGETSGTAKRDDWLRSSDGLLLRRTVATDADVDVIGGGNYSENYEISLLSPDPRR
jgi:hypothetical protein